MALGRSGRALERLLGGLERSVGGSWRGLGCHVGAQDGSEIQKISKKVLLQEAGRSTTVLTWFDFEDKEPTRTQKVCI